MKKVLFFIFSMTYVLCYSQDQALEIYLEKNPDKKYTVNIDDRVLIKTRHFKTGQNRMVVCRLGQIDSSKMYFYPVNTMYRERIYTLSTLKEIGVKTPLRKAYAIYSYLAKAFHIAKGGTTDLTRKEYYSYKIVNPKSRKWEARIIEKKKVYK